MTSLQQCTSTKPIANQVFLQFFFKVLSKELEVKTTRMTNGKKNDINDNSSQMTVGIISN